LQLLHGSVEIERKFLVANDEWRQLAVRSVNIRDGLITVPTINDRPDIANATGYRSGFQIRF
jgi:CYTH domain-containing protein